GGPAGADGLAAAGDAAAAAVVVPVGLRRGRDELAPEPEVERVVGVGPVQGDGGDLRGALDDQMRKGHRLSSGRADGAALRATSARASRISWICSGFTSTWSTPCVRRSSGVSSTPNPVTMM